MPIFGGKQIAELQQKLAIGEQQYNDAQRTIAELSGLIERAGGGEITRMRALVEQTRREQEAAIASLRQQHEQYAKQLAQGQAAAEKRLRDINREDHGAKGGAARPRDPLRRGYQDAGCWVDRLRKSRRLLGRSERTA